MSHGHLGVTSSSAALVEGEARPKVNDSDDEESKGAFKDDRSDDYEEYQSQYSDLRSEKYYEDDQHRKLLVKINEMFALLLMLFSHNINSRDLAFEIGEYDFMAKFKNTVSHEAE